MVRSIIAADLLISDKSSVSSCVSIDFHSAILSLGQLVDESAIHQISWPGFWGEVHTGGGTCTCRRRTDHSSWDREVLCPLDQLVDESGELCLVVQDLPSLHWEGTGIPIQGGRLGRWDTVFSGEMEWVHQHYHVLSYNQVILLGQPSYPLIQISCLLVMAMRGRQWCGLMSSISSTTNYYHQEKSIPTLISHQSGNKKSNVLIIQLQSSWWDDSLYSWNRWRRGTLWKESYVWLVYPRLSYQILI